LFHPCDAVAFEAAVRFLACRHAQRNKEFVAFWRRGRAVQGQTALKHFEAKKDEVGFPVSTSDRAIERNLSSIR
jgi:hypothetical protein